MSKLIYFLGAGAAAPCGYKTTPPLYGTFRSKHPDLILFKEFGTVLDKAIPGGELDIETLYSLVSTPATTQLSKIATQTGRFRDQFLLNLLRVEHRGKEIANRANEAFEQAKEIIIEFIREEFWRHVPNLGPYDLLHIPDAIEKFGAENVSIYTTNYELSLEEYLGEKGIPFDRGDRGDWFDPQSLVKEPRAHPRLVKLHGSLDYYVLEDGRIARIPDIRARGAWKAGLSIQDLYLVPPMMGKVTYERNQQALFDLFREEVKQATNLIVIGTSLRDDEVARVLGKSATTAETILLCCGSKSEALAQKYFDKGAVIAPPGHFPKDELFRKVVASITGSK